MNNLPRRRLRELLGQHGLELVNDPRRTKALLMDLCGDHKLEINLLSAAHEERVAADLLKMPKGTPKAMVFDRLARRLQENRGLAPDTARWAVESWALALNVASPSELSSAPPNAPAQPAPAPAARPAASPNAGPQATTYPLPDIGLPRGDLLMTILQAAMTAGPWALEGARRVLRVFNTLRLTTRALRDFDGSGLLRATVIIGSSLLVGALSWAPGGAIAGALYGLLSAATLDVARVSLIQATIDWLIVGASTAAVLGALTGSAVGVIRYYGETGGTLIGAFAGLALGLLLGPMGISSAFQVGALTGALFALVSLGMVSGHGRNVLLLTLQAMVMAGTCLRNSAGWAAVGKGALWGMLGSFVAFIPLILIGVRGPLLTAIAGWLVGMVAGALVGDKYKLLKYL